MRMSRRSSKRRATAPANNRGRGSGRASSRAKTAGENVKSSSTALKAVDFSASAAMVRNLLGLWSDDTKADRQSYNYVNTVAISPFGGSMQNQAHTESAMRSASLHTDSVGSYRGSELARDLLTKLFRRLPLRVAVRLWNGVTVQVGAARGPESAFTLV